MGVLNVTPDSFSDGGQFVDANSAVEHALQMVEEGANIVDVGGESTRPGADAVDIEEELRRVIPVIEQLHAKSNVLISVDTSKAHVARAALKAGASIINDVTGGSGDAGMFGTAAETKATLIIMHMQGTPRTMQKDPEYADVVTEVADFFRQRFERAIQCGIDPMAMAFDPGIGFGKTLEHNLQLLGNLDRLRVESRPLVVGVSRKSFIGKLIGSTEMKERFAPTIALTSLMRAGGADVVRVHDVKENAGALRVAQAVMEARR